MITNTSTTKEHFILYILFSVCIALVTTIGGERMLRGLIFSFSFEQRARTRVFRLRVELFIHPLMKKQKKSNFYRTTDDIRRKHFNLLFSNCTSPLSLALLVVVFINFTLDRKFTHTRQQTRSRGIH